MPLVPGTAPLAPRQTRWRHSVANPLEKLLRAGEGRILRRLQQVAKAVNALEDEYAHITDDELREASTITAPWRDAS